jgi:hypothetical protein
MQNEIILTWDPSVTPVSGWNIYRGTASGNESATPLNASLITQLPPFSLASVNAVLNGSQTTYNGTIPNGASDDAYVGLLITISGCSNSVNNGSFKVISSTATSITVTNPSGAAETGSSALAQLNPYFYDSTVVPGQAYVYEITTVLNGVESKDSVEVFTPAVPFAPTPAPLTMSALASFGVLAGSTVTNTGATVVNGDVGVFPGTSITGFGFPASISGVFHPGDFVAAAAQNALTNAFADGMSRTGAVTLSGDIGGQRLAPGVYNSASSLAITGQLTLDAQGNPNAVWIFQIGSTLTTATNNSAVVLVGGAQANNVFWIVGSSATFGTNTQFAGNILAQASITITTGVDLNGRALARTGAVTLDTDSVVMMLASPFAGLWTPNTKYTAGQIIFDGLNFQLVKTSGISGSVRPPFSTVLNGNTTDGSVVWQNVQVEIILLNLPDSPPNVPPAPPAAPSNPRIAFED